MNKRISTKEGNRALSNGFTLVELMIALGVGLVLLVMAVPEFSALVHRNRINVTGSDLYAAMSLARNEAIKRRPAAGVRVCPSSNGTSCRNDQVWTGGWIVIDMDTNQVIRVVDAVEAGVQLQADNTVASFVQFNSTGDAFGTSGEFRICHADTATRSRALRVSALGRIEFAGRTRTDCNPGA